MRPRPLDFFGPEDWDGESDPDDMIVAVKAKQAQWDAEFATLSWWQRVLHHLFN